VGKAKKTGKPKQASTAKKTTASSGAATAKSALATQKSGCPAVSTERRAEQDRRSTSDRRKKTEPVAVERRVLQRRVKVNRRRQIDPTTCERDYTPDEIEFMNAMDDYRRLSGRMFPTCSEVLEVIQKLGYEKHLDNRALDQMAPALGGGHSHGHGSEATAV
jgi:hypothetical protein